MHIVSFLTVEANLVSFEQPLVSLSLSWSCIQTVYSFFSIKIRYLAHDTLHTKYSEAYRTPYTVSDSFLRDPDFVTLFPDWETLQVSLET